jgi:NAD(P)-dependent dehydrogenase (short-subunit alcohol dehydrogenase family)
MTLGKNVFVTGASRGIGLGSVRKLLAYPDVEHIFAGARTPNEATELQDLAKQNSKIQIVQFDSLDDSSIRNAVKEVEKKAGEGLNLLINNAGVFLSDGNNSNNPDRDAVLKVFNTNVVGIQMSIPVCLFVQSYSLIIRI